MRRHTKCTMLAMTVVVLLAITGTLALAVDVAPGVQLHGYFQNRIYAASGANAEFRMERTSISATAALPNDSTAYAEVYYQPWAPTSGLYLESAYFDTKVGDGHIRVGKGRRMTFGITPAYPNRKTSNYGLFAEAFTQGRIQGVQYMYQKGALDFGVSAHTAYKLSTTAKIGDIPGDTVYEAAHTVTHLSLVDGSTGGLSRKMAVSSRVGGIWMDGKLKAGVSAMYNRMDPVDIATIATLKATGTKKNYRVWGPDFTYKTGTGFIAQGEWLDAKASSLGYKGYEVTTGWQPPQGWSFFARYAKQSMDIVPTSNQLTWDTNQISLSAVQPLRKGLWLQYEYEINRENPPADTAKVKNNIFFVELFTGF